MTVLDLQVKLDEITKQHGSYLEVTVLEEGEEPCEQEIIDVYVQHNSVTLIIK